MKNPAAVALGRLGGKVTSKAKTRAVRANAKLGGWPTSQDQIQIVHVRATAPDASGDFQARAVGSEFGGDALGEGLGWGEMHGEKRKAGKRKAETVTCR